MTVYAIKGSDNPADVAMVYKSLLEAEGLFGWSYVETADLRQLRDRIELNGWESLSEGEKECYQEFLLRLREDDYVVYVNVPEWGECTLARMAGSYVWRWEHEDFNHRFPWTRIRCNLLTETRKWCLLRSAPASSSPAGGGRCMRKRSLKNCWTACRNRNGRHRERGDTIFVIFPLGHARCLDKLPNGFTRRIRARISKS